VPNAFSPNGDGFNEFFQFFTKGIRQILSVDIYNRWGERVYTLEDTQGEPWDGTYKGEAQGIGVFVYVIRGETYDGDVLQETGNVTLLR
jgi:gliding motility-associated-like protein